MKKALTIVLLAAALAAVGLWRYQSRSAATPSGEAGLPGAAPPGQRGVCDGRSLPQLPASLAPATPDLPGVIAALDATLTDEHRAWLRCFALDDELLARAHQGLGRWLRTVLRLRGASALMRSLQTRSPDDASAMIVIAYAYHLRGQELTAAESAVKVREALAMGGVTP